VKKKKNAILLLLQGVNTARDRGVRHGTVKSRPTHI